MTWLFPRFLASVLAMAAGGLLGYWTGGPIRASLLGALIGGAIGVGIIALGVLVMFVVRRTHPGFFRGETLRGRFVSRRVESHTRCGV